MKKTITVKTFYKSYTSFNTGGTDVFSSFIIDGHEVKRVSQNALDSYWTLDGSREYTREEDEQLVDPCYEIVKQMKDWGRDNLKESIMPKELIKAPEGYTIEFIIK
tara:strand:- start:1615 stop:1932 length:318 start_codon:yes stop_codon:yes gene_type:complete